jgi:two-component sensor histidine kinase/integral membrane sensor domain MASE1
VHGKGDPSEAQLGASALARWLPLSRSDAAATALLALAYWASAAASLLWLRAPEVGPVVWPAAGVALAALAMRGAVLWPGVFAGQLLATLAFGGPLGLDDVLLAVAATLGAAAPALSLRRRRLEPDLTTLRSILWLVVEGGAAAAAIWALASVVPPFLQAIDPITLRRAFLLSWGGYLAGILAVAPLLLSWRRRPAQRLDARSGAHLAASVGVCAVAAYVIFLSPVLENQRGWFIFPALVWPALVFSVRGASLALLLVAAQAFGANILGIGAFADDGRIVQTVLTQQFTAIASITALILAAVSDERAGREQLRASAERLREETEALEILNRTGAAIAAELDLDRAVQLVTDAGVSLSGAQIGAFFYNVTDEIGESYRLYALSGAPRAAFERFGQPRNTPVFAPTFAGEGVVRADDITVDPRYGQNPPHRGMPQGHPPVKSYLAVPVRSRSGSVLGGLLFGHPRAGVFTERAERLIVGLAGQAAIAIDNGRLYQSAQREIGERRRAEEHQRLLMNELNHRVKNTLATVQSMGAQTLRSDRSPAEAREAFVSRLMALSTAHNLLTAERWETAELEDIVRMAVAAFDEPPGARFSIGGPRMRLKAQHALGLAMALHELGSNATKYGALSVEGGRVQVAWEEGPEREVRFIWEESEGPTVQPPIRKGFGTRLIQEGLARELGGRVRIDHLPEGLRCEISFQHDAPTAAFDPPDEA